ncbi:13638_t:CDS:1, partial [Rhizophagus irregularis]
LWKTLYSSSRYHFVATRRQPFNNHAHDTDIVLDTCEGVRPKINEPEALGSYTDLKKKCWD